MLGVVEADPPACLDCQGTLDPPDCWHERAAHWRVMVLTESVDATGNRITVGDHPVPCQGPSAPPTEELADLVLSDLGWVRVEPWRWTLDEPPYGADARVIPDPHRRSPLELARLAYGQGGDPRPYYRQTS